MTADIAAPMAVARQQLQSEGRSLAWWTLALSALSLLTLSFYPTLRTQGEEFRRILESYPPVFQALFGDVSALTTPHGYLNAELFSFMVPALLLVFAIGRGSQAVAGEEERGTLDVLLSHPVTRRRVVMERALAILAGLLLVATGFGLILLLGTRLVSLDIGVGALAAGVAMQVLVAGVFGMLALALGAWRFGRGASAGLAAGLAVVSHLFNGLAQLSDLVESFRPLSPFYHAIGTEPLKNGMPWGSAALLLALLLALLAFALWAFDRRDVRG